MEFISKKEIYPLIEDGVELGYATFKTRRKINFIQTFANENARGRGAAKILNDWFFNHTNKEKANIVILCSYLIFFYEKSKDEFPDINVLGYNL